MNPEGSETKWRLLGKYLPGEWMKIKVVIYPDKKTYDFFLNNEKLAAGLKWFRDIPDDQFTFHSDITPKEHDESPVLCISDAQVSLVDKK